MLSLYLYGEGGEAVFDVQSFTKKPLLDLVTHIETNNMNVISMDGLSANIQHIQY